MGKKSRDKRERREAREQQAQATVRFDLAVTAFQEAYFAQIERDARADACLVRCDGCGLEQVQPPTVGSIHLEDGTELPPAGTCCVVCGCETGTFVASLT